MDASYTPNAVALSVAFATAPCPSSRVNSFRSSGAPSKSCWGEIMAASQGVEVMDEVFRSGGRLVKAWFTGRGSGVVAGDVRGAHASQRGPFGGAEFGGQRAAEAEGA